MKLAARNTHKKIIDSLIMAMALLGSGLTFGNWIGTAAVKILTPTRLSKTVVAVRVSR
jgi:hypothetical protein